MSGMVYHRVTLWLMVGIAVNILKPVGIVVSMSVVSMRQHSYLWQPTEWSFNTGQVCQNVKIYNRLDDCIVSLKHFRVMTNAVINHLLYLSGKHGSTF